MIYSEIANLPIVQAEAETERQALNKWVGSSLPRREALRFVKGAGEFTDDIHYHDALQVCAVRSPYAHAQIIKIDYTRAMSMPGVVAVFTGRDLINGGLQRWRNNVPSPADTLIPFPLAVERVRYADEPVAVVVAKSAAESEDAASEVEVEYEPLTPVLDARRAMDRDSPIVYDTVGSNVVFHHQYRFGDVDDAFRNSNKVISRKNLHAHRFTSAPLEPLCMIAEFDAKREEFTIISSMQGPEAIRDTVARSLGIEPRSLHFICPDIGGGFGIKQHLEWVILLCWISKQLCRPVRWSSTQSEQLTASHHSEEMFWDAELAVDFNGKIQGIRARCILDRGANLNNLRGVSNILRNPAELYSFKNIELEFDAVMTNKCPCSSNRGYGKLQYIFMLERMIDEAARELKLDPLELRILNFVRPEEMPYAAPNGAVYDGGDYPEIVRHVAEIFQYRSFKEEQKKAFFEGRYLGCGIAVGMESNPPNESRERWINPHSEKTGQSEAALVRLDRNGKVFVASGDVPQGQGHETTSAQIVADQLGLSPEDVEVSQGYDSLRDPHTPFSITSATRWVVMGTGALLGACKILRNKVLDIAAHMLDASKESLLLANKKVTETSSGKSLSLEQIARVAYLDLANLPPGMEPGLEARYTFSPQYSVAGGNSVPDKNGLGNMAIAYTYEVTLVGIEIDPETFNVKLKRVATSHDVGTRINPAIVDSLQHGAIAHHLGAALFETMEYDDEGHILTSTFMDYLVPTACDLPTPKLDHIENPSMFTPLGVRGCAEGAGTPLAATMGAVADALAPLGITISESHITPDQIYKLLNRS